MNIAKWTIEEETGYKPITTYFEDFSIADLFGLNAIIDTYKKAKKELTENANANYKELTEFSMALNWKIWQHYEKDESKAQLYNSLWIEIDALAQQLLTGDNLHYYYKTTD